METADLLMRLYDKYSRVVSADQRSDIDELIREEAPLALLALFRNGIDQGDLLPGEVTAGLEMARVGRFLKSSPYLSELLTDYQSTHLPV